MKVTTMNAPASGLWQHGIHHPHQTRLQSRPALPGEKTCCSIHLVNFGSVVTTPVPMYTSHAKTLGKYRLSCHVHPFWASKAWGLTLRPIIQCGSIIIHGIYMSVVDEIPHGFGPSTFRHSILPTYQNPFTHWAQIYALHLLAHCGLRSRSIVPREIWSWVFLDCWSTTWKPGLLILHPNTSDPVSWDMINQWILLETDSETDMGMDSDVTGATTDHGYCSLDHPVPTRLDHSPSKKCLHGDLWWSNHRIPFRFSQKPSLTSHTSHNWIQRSSPWAKWRKSAQRRRQCLRGSRLLNVDVSECDQKHLRFGF